MSLSSNTKYILEQKDSYQDQEYLYIIMEFMNGGSLDDLLLHYSEEEKPIPINVIKWIIQELMSALDELHTSGFVHR